MFQMKKLKILIVEDDEISRDLLRIQVRMFAKEVLEARTGVEAIEICRRNPDIDLVLMDIQLPEMDGFEATHLIREFDKNVVIIAQTAYGYAGERKNAIEAGCTDYIEKPILKEHLIALIQKYFLNQEPG
jgi:CheY-like chemotaxis protein